MKYALLVVNYNRTDSVDSVYNSYDAALAGVNRICAEHNWRYNLEAGVMLGDPFAQPRDMTTYGITWTANCEFRNCGDWSDNDVAMYFTISPENRDITPPPTTNRAPR